MEINKNHPRNLGQVGIFIMYSVGPNSQTLIALLNILRISYSTMRLF
jgi:hypothetical protein